METVQQLKKDHQYILSSVGQTATSNITIRLQIHDIGDGIIDWIEKLLTNRRQRVAEDGKFQTGNQF